jgi:hypothetical protein
MRSVVRKHSHDLMPNAVRMFVDDIAISRGSRSM